MMYRGINGKLLFLACISIFLCILYIAPFFNHYHTVNRTMMLNRNVEHRIDDDRLKDNIPMYYEIKHHIRDGLVDKVKLDITKPDMKLKDNTVNMYLNTSYHEFGYTAIDNHDGVITNEVKISSNINTHKVGIYHVIYRVRDKNGNESIIKRQVNVVNHKYEVGVPILLYHFFYDSSKGELPRRRDIYYSIDIANFDEQMKYLVDNNYYFPSWDELEQYIDGNISLPDKSVIVTIDDGNESFFRLAYPVLKKYNIKATLFVITSWIPLSNYSFVDRNLIDYESHTDNMHRGGCKTKNGGIFQCIDYNTAYNDLERSISVVNSNEVFAYPFGDYNDRAIELLKKVGFKMAVTVEGGRVKEGANKYLLPRIGINTTVSLDRFINFIN